MRRRFRDLSPPEVLALAISLEEEDSRIFGEFARQLRPNYPKAAAALDGLRREEDEHRHLLVETFRRRYGEEIPLIRRQDVRGFVRRDSLGSIRPWDVERVRKQVGLIELENAALLRPGRRANRRRRNAAAPGRPGRSGAAARSAVLALDSDQLPGDEKEEETRIARQMFLLQVIQPGLVGLMDGSVSTLAPLFAAAFATRNSHNTFLVGVAASVGAGISMGFAEALSDDGSLTGRGHPFVRGLICALMTLLGGLGHALPYLFSALWGDGSQAFWIATAVATAVVLFELLAITWIRNRYMDSPFAISMLQVVVGGILVFLAGILIGSS